MSHLEYKLPSHLRDNDRCDCGHRVDEHDAHGCLKCFCEWWRAHDAKANLSS